MEGMVSEGERADVVFMDPPRTGSTEKFLTSMVKLGPSRIVYISCGPDTLARDLEFLTKHGYVTRKNTAGRHVQLHRTLRSRLPSYKAIYRKDKYYSNPLK